jgi:helix-turn-helix protein
MRLMAGRIGSDLQRARTRREIELPEVEAATRIRARFLSAIEDEDWGALPGGVYTRGFIRTYAAYLGLDGDRLAEDYRREAEGEVGPRPGESLPAPQRAGEARRSRSWARQPALIALVAVSALAATAILAFPDGGNDGDGISTGPPPTGAKPTTGTRPASPPAGEEGLSMRLSAEGEVWACVLGASGRRLVDGQILRPGAEAGPFRSGSFTLSFGNGEVTMTINGKQAEIPATSSPIGYAIDAEGGLEQLSEAERPTCE